ncbi:unnamed protein product [Chondrus crispus]|uniref:Phytanoyl-CoA dioxygenase n=1 Tax=Chondrus crispus TaxID=2769 RepID=R7QI68_CHOCR|nr:unnamed protein product [Chondrus crispus]CDF38212.1 unnamed protein product [Chondrus crispus]|eukprot:XP_005718097.1 unnamed protein product [Chondrus crispus]
MPFAPLLAFAVLGVWLSYCIRVQLSNHRKMSFTRKDRDDFVRDGYVILQNVVPVQKARDALSYVDEAFATNRYSVRENKDDKLPAFWDKEQNSSVLTDLVLKTGILPALEHLYGTGNVAILGNAGQIAFRPRNDRMIAKGFQKAQLMGSTSWHIDDGPGGKYVKSSSCFTTLVGVPLSPGQEIDENRGQLHVWPGRRHLFF